MRSFRHTIAQQHSIASCAAANNKWSCSQCAVLDYYYICQTESKVADMLLPGGQIAEVCIQGLSLYL